MHARNLTFAFLASTFASIVLAGDAFVWTITSQKGGNCTDRFGVDYIPCGPVAADGSSNCYAPHQGDFCCYDQCTALLPPKNPTRESLLNETPDTCPSYSFCLIDQVCCERVSCSSIWIRGWPSLTVSVRFCRACRSRLARHRRTLNCPPGLPPCLLLLPPLRLVLMLPALAPAPTLG